MPTKSCIELPRVLRLSHQQYSCASSLSTIPDEAAGLLPVRAATGGITAHSPSRTRSNRNGFNLGALSDLSTQHPAACSISNENALQVQTVSDTHCSVPVQGSLNCNTETRMYMKNSCGFNHRSVRVVSSPESLFAQKQINNVFEGILRPCLDT